VCEDLGSGESSINNFFQINVYIFKIYMSLKFEILNDLEHCSPP